MGPVRRVPRRVPPQRLLWNQVAQENFTVNLRKLRDAVEGESRLLTWEGIALNAAPEDDFSYMAVGYSDQREPHGGWDLITDEVTYDPNIVTLVPKIRTGLQTFRQQYPGENARAIRCLMATCDLVEHRQLPYGPRLGYAVQCQHELVVDQSKLGLSVLGLLVPVSRTAREYRHVQCVEKCLGGLAVFLQKVDCWSPEAWLGWG